MCELDTSKENFMISRLIALAPFFATEPNAGLWANPIDGLIVSIAAILIAIGVVIVIWGAYCSVLRLIALEATTVRLRLPSTDTAPARLLFATYLLSGLDFLIAGGLIRTLAGSDWYQLSVLGGIVGVRTLLGLGLKWQAIPSSIEMPPASLQSSTAGKNGASACRHVPAPSTPDAKKPSEDLTPVAAQAAQ
jgi:uncharacterized membrane protein